MDVTKKTELANMILRFGMIDGSHYKQWLLDQTLRAILGKSYDSTLELYNHNPEYQDWDEGIAP